MTDTMLTPDAPMPDDTRAAHDVLDALAVVDPTDHDEIDDDEIDDDEIDDDTIDHGELGQATTEYALVLLGAALVALLLIAWATSGGGAGKVGHLLDAVLDAITSKL